MLSLLKRSVGLYRTNASLMAGYAAWLLLPYAGMILALMVNNETVAQAAFMLFLVAEIALWIWIELLVAIAAASLAVGQKPDAKVMHDRARLAIWPVVVVNLLQMLIVLGGVILLVIPGIIFAVWYFFAPLSAMLDGTRGTEALSASRNVSRGRFWRAAWLIVGGPLVISLVYYPIVSVLIVLIASLTGTNLDVLISDNPPMWSDMIATIGDVFLMPLTVTYFVLVYQELKSTMKPL